MAPWLIIIILVAFFGLVVLAVFLVRKYSKAFQSDEKPKSVDEVAAEEVDRVLEDVEDEEVAAKMQEYVEAEEAEKAEKEEEELGEDKPVESTPKE